MLKKLREERAAAHKRIRQMAEMAADEKHDWTSDNETEWGKVNDDFDAYTGQIDKLDRVEKLAGIMEFRENEARPGRDNDTPPQRTEADNRALALQGWCLRSYGEDTTDIHQAAADAIHVNLDAPHLELSLGMDYRQIRHECRAISTSPGEGGDTIPEGFVNRFELAQLQFGGVRQVAEILRTATGNRLPWPTSDDTGNKGALVSENTAVTEQDITTAQLVLEAFKYTSKLVKTSVELLQDSAFNLANILGSMLGERIARITNEDFTVGDGVNRPRGIVTASSLGVTTVGTKFIAEELIDLEHSVDPAYRVPGAGFMMHDNIVRDTRKLKNGEGEFIWKAGLAEGRFATLLGWPIQVNQDMASSQAAGNKVALFGLLNKYKIRDVATLRLRRLVERFAEADQEGFVSFMRVDGDLLDAGTKPIKHLAIKV